MSASSSTPAARSRWVVAGCAVVLVLATLAAYGNTFHVPFVLDDTFAIVDNPSLRHLGELRRVLFPDAGYGITVSGRPLLNLSLALCYAVSGTDPWSYHAFNLLIHVLAGLTFFGVVRRTLLNFSNDDRGMESRRRGDASTFLAFAVALLWLLHPLQTEAVTYVVQRTESMMGLFFLLTLYTFIRAVVSRRPWVWRGLSVLACLCAVGTKEVAATAPALVFLYDRTFVGATFREAWRRRCWWHLSLAATWLPLALLVASTGWNRGGTAGFNVGISPWAYWGTQFEAISRYLKQSLWPHPLIFEYGKFWSGFWTAVPFALIVLPLVLATVIALWRWPVAGFLGAWFFLILAPTSLVPGTIQMVVEHRMYLSLAAVIVAAVFGLRELLRRRIPPDAGEPARHRWSLVALGPTVLPCVALALPLGVLTTQRNYVYRDELALWRQTVAARPSSALAQSNLGTALYQRNRVPEAMEHYQRALRLDPQLVSNHYNLGLAYAALGRWPEAVAHDREAVRINPRFYPAWYQLGLALLQSNQPSDSIPAFAQAARLNPAMAEAQYEWGVALARLDRDTEAIDRFRESLRLKPDFIAAECDQGAALLRLNRATEAAACFQRALRLDATGAETHFNLGLALARLGSMQEAMVQYAEAVRLDPRSSKAHYNLGLALGQTGRVPEAVEHLRAATQLEPAFADAHSNLAVALAMLGRPSEAVTEYETALRLQPDSVSAHHGLGLALLQLHREAEARRQFETALRINPEFEPARAMLAQLRTADGRH